MSAPAPRPFSAAERASMFGTLDAQPDDAATWSTSYAGARRIRATIVALEDELGRLRARLEELENNKRG